MPVTAQQIEACLKETLDPLMLVVQDDSHLHAGHAGAREGRHFTVHVVSQRFHGLSRLARHRLVYDAVAPLVPQGIHALALRTQAPGES